MKTQRLKDRRFLKGNIREKFLNQDNSLNERESFIYSTVIEFFKDINIFLYPFILKYEFIMYFKKNHQCENCNLPFKIIWS